MADQQDPVNPQKKEETETPGSTGPASASQAEPIKSSSTLRAHGAAAYGGMPINRMEASAKAEGKEPQIEGD